MVKKGKNFSGKVTPLFDSMLVQQTKDEGEASKRASDSQPIPSPPHPSKDQPQIHTDPSPRPYPSIAIPDSNPEGSGGNHGGQLSSDRSLSENEDGLTLQSQEAKERSQTTYHTSQSLDEECCTKDKIGKEDFSEEKGVQKEYVSKQERKSVKSSKGKPSVHNDPAFDDLDDDAMNYMKTKDAQDEGRTSSVVLEEKESTDKEVSIEAHVSTVKLNEGTAKRNKGTDKQDGGTDSTKNKQKEKEKGVEIRNAEDTERARPTLTRSILTLRPLPKIDPKDKGKKRIEEEDESDTEPEDITEAEKKFKQLVNDEEVARKVQVEWEAKEEKKRLDEEEATKASLSNEYDFIQARLNADKILHVGGKKHSDLMTKSFDEIQVLYEKMKRSDDSFIAIGSAEDAKMIKEMNEQAADASKKRVKKDDSVKGEIKEEEGTRKRKLGKRKKMKSKKRKFTSKDDEEL
ncbi:hypothetical protein Tco_1249005 [Tanacetum coccineum]